MRDMVERGRSKASRHDSSKTGRGKVTVDEIRMIRQRFANKELIKTIAQDLNLSRFIISSIVRRRTWKHVD